MEGNMSRSPLFLVMCIFWLTPSVMCDRSGYINIQISADGEILFPSDFENSGKYRKDCSELREEDVSTSGVYLIQPVTYSKPFYVYCDMETDGGGWTVFQRRLDGSVGFYRGWEEYKEGFGNVNSEFWLGNEKMFYLTAQGNYELRVDLEDFEGETRYAVYNKFRIGDETAFYKIMLGSYSGDAGDSLSHHNGRNFTTKDADNDMKASSNCAVRYTAAWWYAPACHKSNLNGIYHGGDHDSFADGINWFAWHGFYYSLKSTEMKVRRGISG